MSPSKAAADGTITIDVADFTRTRDGVLSTLLKLNAAISDVIKAYVNHSDVALGHGPNSLGIAGLDSITDSLHEYGLIPARASSPGAKSEAGEKKKRKRRAPDPNAPKRALTPFFLYMQTSRPLIAQELGDGAKPKEVSDEGTRRWAEMPEAKKEIWKKMYADNLAVYKEKVKAYKAGVTYSDDAKAASQLHQGIEGVETGSESESEDESSASEEEEEEEETPEPEPVREPTPPRSTKSRRRSEGKPASAKEAAAPAAAEKESPEKKKRGAAARKDEAAPASTKKAATESKRAPKKKRKSEAAAE
ncbi:HMG-box [Aspergillus heteromorphus CBS 117.55]|uniref:HMG-box n=1 Tax=Aspergillus heteromorphus CBS 117.55 TaxID=1448321 RepID=A0A317WCE5_9EURO|nr:HMG-box [Aspergillus heteromorphus CBS 117.55]PWY82872.1 HMG-box [Aspergillus heteromorphus CBS 117.55]